MTRQKPVTEGMSPEELKKFKEDAREAQRGNVHYSLDIADAWRGRSSYTTSKPLSDYTGERGLFYKEQYKKIKQDREVLATRQNKSKQIEKWEQAIEKLTAQIEKIKADPTLVPREKQSKIEKRQQIIENYKYDIQQATEYIERKNTEMRTIYGKNEKTK